MLYLAYKNVDCTFCLRVCYCTLLNICVFHRQDYLKLGPLELKLLSIKGQKMPIHVQAPLPQEEVKAKSFKPDEWPITQPMLKSTVMTPVSGKR